MMLVKNCYFITNTMILFYAFSAGALWLLGTLTWLRVNPTNIRADRWLATFFYFTAAIFTQLFLEGSHMKNEVIIHLLELPRWATFPCFYMAVSYWVEPTKSSKSWPLHFAPFIAFLLLSMLYLIPSFFSKQIHLPHLPQGVIIMIRYFFFAQCVYYWVACYRLLQKHQDNILCLSSYTEKINLIWIKHMMIVLLFVIGIRLLSIVHIDFAGLSPILYFIGLIALAYFTLTQRSIYSTETPLDLLTSPSTKETHEERLTPDQVDTLKNIVLQKTTQEKLYLNHNLTLSILATKLGMQTHDLSYVLNRGLEKNFYQFINEMRTAEAKRLLLSDQAKQFDMVGIAIRAGFNSKTTFYTSFKKETGMTPKVYMSMHRSNSTP